MILDPRLRSLLLSVKERLRKHHRAFYILRNLMLKLKMHRFLRATVGADMPVASGAHYTRSLVENHCITYPLWQSHFDTPPEKWVTEQERRNRQQPPLSVVIRADESAVEATCATISSLLATVGLPWRAFVMASGQDAVTPLIESVRKSCGDDPRVSVCHILPEHLGEWVVLVTGVPRLRPHALVVMAHYLEQNPRAWIAYSDEDAVDDKGNPTDPWFKPEFSPFLALQGALLGKVVTLQAQQPDVGCWLSQLQYHQDWDEALTSLAVQAKPAEVLHVPHVLYHDPSPPRLRPLPVMAPPPGAKVSIIIPTRDRWDLLGPCLDSIMCSDWPRDSIDILVIDNGSTEALTLDALAQKSAEGVIRVIRDDGVFNWSRLNNLGAASCASDVLIFLNNDTKVIDPLWIRKIVDLVSQEGVGAVGCKLLYPDRTVQHAGVILGIQGLASHAHLYLGEHAPGYRGLARLTREVSAVTGACLGVSKAAFERVGGFREALRVAFNDVVFCLDLLEHGYRNICIADALLLHYESKTRGYDDTAEKVKLLLSEARTAWKFHKSLLRNDPFYSPNLSLEHPYEPAFAPRCPRPWTHSAPGKPRIMLLSCTHAIGHGVAVVVALHADALVKAGFEVIVGGQVTANDFPYLGCERVEVHDPRDAAFLAAKAGVDLIVAHTPPFFSVARWTGACPRVIAYDYGEPPCDWFPDAVPRRQVQIEKEQVLVMADRVYAISDAIASESLTPVTGVIPLGNSHLGTWDGSLKERRQRVRSERGWENSFVVLNVCRFHEGERHYKGVDTYVSIMQATKAVIDGCVFVQAGKGTEQDTLFLESNGLEVVANLSDEEMVDLYCAADAYMNFSRWEGYNLGIGQALAMGLPVLASDIPAHRAFNIPVSNDEAVVLSWLRETKATTRERVPKIQTWDKSLELLIDIIREVLVPEEKPRLESVASSLLCQTS